MKNTFHITTDNIILNGKKQNFPTKIRKGKDGLSHTPFQHHTGSPGQSVRQEKEMKNTLIRKEDIKLSLFRDDMITWVENPKEPAKTSGTNK